MFSALKNKAYSVQRLAFSLILVVFISLSFLYAVPSILYPLHAAEDATLTPTDTTTNPNASTTDTSTTSPTTGVNNPSTSGSSGGNPISSTNYKAPQNANYTLQNLFHAGLCEMAGISPIGQCIGTGPDGKVMAYDRVPGGGAMGALASLTSNMYTPPTSTAYYVANLGRDFGIENTYAQSVQGSGAGLIAPVEALWRVVRNFSYIIFTLIFLAVGFMIMLRKKLNPQTVITIQSALPGLVIGLFLVTFSYFITALIIDISFFGIPIVANLFAQSGAANTFGNNAQDFQNLAAHSNMFDLFGRSSSQAIGDVSQFHGSITGLLDSVGFFGNGGQFAVRGITAVIAGLAAGLVLLNPIAGLLGGAVGLFAPEIISALIPLILIIGMFIQLIRLFLALLRAYITILIMSVLAPLLITFGSLPGRGGTITFWWKTLLANTLIFPAVFATFLFAGLVLASRGGVWVSPPPLFGGLPTQIIQLIVGYGLILGTPAIPDLVKNLLGVKDVPGIAQSATAGALAGFAVGRGSLGRAYGQTMKGTGISEAREMYRREQGTARARDWADPHTGLKGWQKRLVNWLP